MKIQKGDKVKVLYGKDSGKIATVLSVNPVKNKVVVDGLNIYKKALKGDGKTRKSSIVEIVKPMYASKVMFVCPECNKPTRVGMKLEGDNFVRVCKKCNKVISIVKVEKKKVVKEVVKKDKVSKKKDDK